MVDVPKELAGKLVEAATGGKVVSTEVVYCRQYGNENIEAVLVVFDDGHVQISCPIAPDKCTCHYEARWKAVRKKWWQRPLVTTVIAYLAEVIFFVLLWYLLKSPVNG